MEKQKEGTLKVVSNGDSAKAPPKRRGRWDQTEDTGTPSEKKKKADASAWDKEDVSFPNLYFEACSGVLTCRFC